MKTTSNFDTKIQRCTKPNDVQIETINFSLTRNEDDFPGLEVQTKDVCEALNYEQIDFELKTSVKMLRITAKFKAAINEKHFKLYVFDVEDSAGFTFSEKRKASRWSHLAQTKKNNLKAGIQSIFR